MAHLKLMEPVAVSLAPRDCQKWGQWQFPQLSRMQNGGIALTYSVGGDSNGGNKATRNAYSMDGGKTWTHTDEFPSPIGLVLPNGDLIRRRGGRFIPADDLCLPKPDKEFMWDVEYQELYRVENFPICFRGRRIERYCPESRSWKMERKLLEVPQEYMVITSDDLIRHPFGSEGRWINLQNIQTMKVSPSGEVWLVYDYASAQGEYPFWGVAFFVSGDNGHTFEYRSHVVYDDSFTPSFYQPPQGPEIQPPNRPPEGFNEPALAFLPDGTALCLMRTDSRSSCFIMRSTDSGYTWSRPEEFDTFGVRPYMVNLDNGAILAVYGRPGVRLRACSDPKGKVWSEPVDVLTGYDSSCSNCTMVPVGPDEVLLAYSDFHWPDGEGGYTKAIVVRRIKATV